MNTLQTYKTIPLDEFRRNLGELKKAFSRVTFIITDRGKPIAHVSAPPETKRKNLMKLAGAWKDTDLDNDALWEDVLKRKSRKTTSPSL